MEREREASGLAEIYRRQQEGLRDCLGEEFESSALPDMIRWDLLFS